VYIISALNIINYSSIVTNYVIIKIMCRIFDSTAYSLLQQFSVRVRPGSRKKTQKKNSVLVALLLLPHFGPPIALHLATIQQILRMSAKNHETLLRQLGILSCSICMDSYNEGTNFPMSLTCVHTYWCVYLLAILI
jgi:hypothetical protein